MTNKINLVATIFCFLAIVLSCKKHASEAVTEWKLSPNNHAEKLLTTIPDSVKAGLVSTPTPTSRVDATTSYGCGSYLSGDYYGTGYYAYAAYNIDLSSTPQGSTINVAVSSFDIPNRFTVKDQNNAVVAYTSWMGYVNYSGPWGQSLNTAETQTLTFTKDIGSAFTLLVETVTGNGYSDSWNVTFNCTAPALTLVNPGNAGIFHNNIITAVDNSFASSPQTLFKADSLFKIYEKSYVNSHSINLPSYKIDSSYTLRNQFCQIVYSENAIYLGRINWSAIADSIMTITDASYVVASSEKTIIDNLVSYYGQYQNGQIDYNTMKTDIATLRNSWNQQGYNTSLHQGDISAYALNIADSSVSFWYRYNATYGQRFSSGFRTEILPAWIVGDVIGAVVGGVSSGVYSKHHTGKVDWWDVGWGALSGAAAVSLPGIRWTKFFKW